MVISDIVISCVISRLFLFTRIYSTLITETAPLKWSTVQSQSPLYTVGCLYLGQNLHF